MTRPNITPGPWYLGKRAGAKRAIYGDKGAEIALPFDFFMEDEEALANARAIAAVPALLEALEMLVKESGRSLSDLDPDISGHKPLIAAYSALIAAGYQF